MKSIKQQAIFCLKVFLLSLLILAAKVQKKASLASYPDEARTRMVTRANLEYLPPGYDTNLAPSIVFLHGSEERGNIRDTFRFSPFTSDKTAMAIPEGSETDL